MNQVIAPAYAEKIIIGCSVFGTAYALSSREKCLILEPSILVGSEFSSTYRCNPIDLNKAVSGNGQRLLYEMSKRNMLSNIGEIHIPPVSGILAGMLLEKNIPVMFMCHIVSIKACADGYIIEYFGEDGRAEITCGSILDTTSCGVYCGNIKEYSCTKKLSAVLCRNRAFAGEITEPCAEAEAMQIIKGRFEDEYVITLTVLENENYVEARNKLLRCFQENSTLNAQFRIAAISPFFSYEYSEPFSVNISDNFIWSPSSSYENLLAAFEGGAR